MPNPLTRSEIQAKLDLATKLNLPHYFWDLPEWKKGDPAPEIPDNVVGDDFTDDNPLGNWTDISDKGLDCDRKLESHPNEEGKGQEHPVLKLIPHPLSDCGHVDPGSLGADRAQERQKKRDYRDAIRGLESLMEDGAKRDGALRQLAEKIGPSLKDAWELLVDDEPGGGGNQPTRIPRGMQRLRLVFEWMLCRVTTIFGDINKGLHDNDQAWYSNARKAYHDLLRDLDDREPGIGKPVQAPPPPGPIEPGVRGYGRAVKWIYILPLIHGGRIKGAKVMAKWNPHISSSGIPIKH